MKIRWRAGGVAKLRHNLEESDFIIFATYGMTYMHGIQGYVGIWMEVRMSVRSQEYLVNVHVCIVNLHYLQIPYLRILYS